MIEILKHGNQYDPNLATVRKFYCTKCGCFFKSDQDHFHIYSPVYWAKCPECGKVVHGEVFL